MKKAILALAAAVALAGSSQAQQLYSDYRPLNGDKELDAQKKLLSLASCSFVNITTNATAAAIKTGKGVLHSITVNTKGATNTATVYDSLTGSGTKIGTIDTTGGTETLIYDIAFTTGLSVVTAGGTPADLTIAYR